jgi:hypothetical protein
MAWPLYSIKLMGNTNMIFVFGEGDPKSAEKKKNKKMKNFSVGC